MSIEDPKVLTERISLIDGFDMNISERTGTYVINEDKLTLIETGPSPSVPYIKEGLKKLGHSLDQVKYVIVTHIHLDHAGGAGLLLQDCPNAKLVVHPKGARHLSDPSRLVAGAKLVYGDRFESLFEPVLPVPEEKLLIKGEGDELEIGPDCKLVFWNSPGHANHHLAILDPVSKGIFTGDTAGIHYEQLAKENIEFHLPSTSPNQFDPDLMRESILRMKEEGFNRAFYGHYGMTENPEAAFDQTLEWLVVFMEEAEAAVKAQETYIELTARLKKQVTKRLRSLGINDDHEVYMLIELDLMVGSMGLMDYLSKRDV
ncbi:MBL fold metallo-hydrolase [Planomicrobium sp. MB-3u-38]|uniref:MBL fold metallo-hydrolase n=1 Tax=Planomicrobium sp. MB-3u-38 TaxID=2058318 RepID=UPI000C7DFD0F|nr:MBL fold metallo-hydrolase [Planomicrobium sp. MB-3u-38]PKH10140.1 MBL fold metallo-hydrolase [Planomicrobium sp. MB-3u-38]